MSIHALSLVCACRIFKFFCQCFAIFIIGLVTSLLKFISRHFGLVGWFAAGPEFPGLIHPAASASRVAGAMGLHFHT